MEEQCALLPPKVLICAKELSWLEEISQAIPEAYIVQQKCGYPQLRDLSAGADGTLPPDVVLWRFDGKEAIQETDYLDLVRWAPGTKFVFLRHRRWAVPLAYYLVHNPRKIIPVVRFWFDRFRGKDVLPSPFLPPRSSTKAIIAAVESAASNCWWSQLRDLDFPACQVSLSGRILRANQTMTRRFGQVTGGIFRIEVEKNEENQLPTDHPISRASRLGKACQDFVESPRGQLQLVCLPDQDARLGVRTLSVLMPEMGNRTRVFQFARKKDIKNLDELHRYIVNCAVELGYPRVRLYRTEAGCRELYGVAAHGFADEQKRVRFEKGEIRLRIGDDRPTTDTMDQGIPALCRIVDRPSRDLSQAGLIRAYPPPRAFEADLEVEGLEHWIEAPLLVPGGAFSDLGLLGKLVVDRARESNQLSIRDALDVGFLGMMAAGAIHAFNQAHSEIRLRDKKQFLTSLLDVLPQLAFEKQDLSFYRAIAAILSCRTGLAWQQVMLFIVDSTGEIGQASCEMALGGRGDPEAHRVRDLLNTLDFSLSNYVEDAIKLPTPSTDSLFRTWVLEDGTHRHVSFAPGAPSNPITRALSPGNKAPYLELNPATDAWCQAMNRDFPGTFAGDRVYAFPLTKSFDLEDAEFNRDAFRTQPVGVALVTPIGVGARDSQDLEITRVTLDLLGSLIAQRWTSRRIRGMFGFLTTIYHSKLAQSWNSVQEFIDGILAQSGANSAASNDYEAISAAHSEYINRIQIAQATLRNLHQGIETDLDFKQFVQENVERWKREWSGPGQGPVLVLDISLLEDGIRVPCDRFILGDVLACLIQNAVQVARDRNADRQKSRVHVTISARNYFSNADEFVEVRVEDDAGGVLEQDEPTLFVKDVSGRTGGTGRGLALARAELLMYSGDLKYVPAEPGQDRDGAVFQIIFCRRAPHGNEKERGVHTTHRRQQSR
jgi:signal transduction histidine kinase